MSKVSPACTDCTFANTRPCRARGHARIAMLFVAALLASGCMGLAPGAVPDVPPVDYESSAGPAAIEPGPVAVPQPEPAPFEPLPGSAPPAPVTSPAPQATQLAPGGVIPAPTAQQIATPPLAAKSGARATSAQEQRIAALELSLLNMSNELAWLRSQPASASTAWGTPGPQVVPGPASQSQQERIATLEQNMQAINNELLVLRGPVTQAPMPVQPTPVQPAPAPLPSVQVVQPTPVPTVQPAAPYPAPVQHTAIAAVPQPNPSAVATPPLRRGTRPQALPDQDIPVPGSKKAAASSGGQSSVYQIALKAYEAKRYTEAMNGFDAYLAQSPQGKLAPNAIYWKGEVRYAQNDYVSAILLFRDVVTRFPKHAKAPDAMLKIIMSYQRLQDRDNASMYLRILNEDYPESSAAKRANSLGIS